MFTKETYENKILSPPLTFFASIKKLARMEAPEAAPAPISTSCQIMDQTMEDLNRLLQQEVDRYYPEQMEDGDLYTDAEWDNFIDNADILQAIYDTGFERPSVVQIQAIPKLCPEKVSFLGQAPAGCGKTAAFTVPMLYHVDKKIKSIQSVCLCHTPQLVEQAMETFQSLNDYYKVNVASLIDDKSQIPPDCHVIFARPLPLAKSIKTKKLDVSHVKIVIVDEADRLLNRMGADFRPMEDLLQRLLPETAQLGFFSATFPDTVTKEVERLSGNRKLMKYQKRSLPKSISHWLIHQERENDYSFVGELCKNFGGLIMIITGSKVKAGELEDYLRSQGIWPQVFFGGRDDRVIRTFKEGEVKVLITTDLGLRGLDVPELRLVINLDFPYQGVEEDGVSKGAGPDVDLYMHRAGRCGRFGRDGVVLNLYQNDDGRDSYERIFRELGIEKAYHLVAWQPLQ